jgi:hypothetical protein
VRADVLDDDGRPTDVANKAYVDAVAAANTTVSGGPALSSTSCRCSGNTSTKRAKSRQDSFTAVDQSGNPVVTLFEEAMLGASMMQVRSRRPSRGLNRAT